MKFFNTRFARLLIISSLLFIFPVTDALAGRCAEDIKRIDEAIKNQYGGNGAWWEWFACPVCLGSELKKKCSRYQRANPRYQQQAESSVTAREG